MSAPVYATAHSVAALLPKLQDADSDHRFMSLNDLFNILSSASHTILSHDYGTANRTVDGILKTLDDQNGEVQNLAVKWYSCGLSLFSIAHQYAELTHLICLSLTPLVVKLPPSILPPLIEKLSNLTIQNSVDRSISSTALRTVVTSLPRPVPSTPNSKAVDESYSAISRVLIPRLVGHAVMPSSVKNAPKPPPGLLQLDRDEAVEPDAVDVLVEVARCFGPMLDGREVAALTGVVTNIFNDPTPSTVVKKRAVVALSALAHHFSDDLLSSYVSTLIEGLRSSHLTPAKRRLLINITGALARSIPDTFGPYLKTLTPFVLSAVSEAELTDQLQSLAEDGDADPEADEVREAALIALESFLACCSSEMRFYTAETIDAALLFLRYDPNVTVDDSDSDMGGVHDPDDFEMDDDVEQDTGMSDDDDSSWKVRRCAAKLIYTLIATRANGDLLENGTLYDKVAPVLLERFKEREENVRLEIMATTGLLIRKTGENAAAKHLTRFDESDTVGHLSQSRKRRRGSSDSSMVEGDSPAPPPTVTALRRASPPLYGPQASLAQLIPSIVDLLIQLAKLNSPGTRLALIMLLKDIVAVQPGGLTADMPQVIELVADSIKASGTMSTGATLATTVGGAGSATGNNIRLEALKLAAAITESHPSQVLQPFLEKLMPGISLAARDRYYKIASEAIHIVELFVKVLTPHEPQSQKSAPQHLLEGLYDIILERTHATNADGEVRQQAVRALGTLLARTSASRSTPYFSKDQRTAALEVLAECLKNETTRMTAIRAAGDVASHASAEIDLSSEWVHQVSLELASQLRKSNRSVRIISLATLRSLVLNAAGKTRNFDAHAKKTLIDSLTPLLTANDVALLGPTLVILGSLMQSGGGKIVDDALVQAICSLTFASIAGAALDALLLLARRMAEAGEGQPLMHALLKDVGVNGDTNVVGKLIGTLLVSGGPTLGVKMEDFVAELQEAQDDQRRCLALAVLGETGLRMGSASTLEPKLFMAHFKSKLDQVPLSAAVALGRAGAGDPAKYLPVILKELGGKGSSRYLLLHSIKEMLQRTGDAQTDLSPFARRIWDKLVQTSRAEDCRAVGAECLGRLTMVDPSQFIASLQDSLKDKDPSVRGVVIQAIRYALADSSDVLDDSLQPVIIEMLTTMLADGDLENARLALTTLISAVHNKPYLIVPNLGKLVPAVMTQSVIKPELVREVEMGPFMHKIDDGLELRKSAYETLFALMETAFSRLNAVEFFDRVMAGLEDEHDIRVLCNLMLTKLVVLEPDETRRRLDQIAAQFRAILSVKLKESAVKQEVEKAEEANKSVLRVTCLLNDAFPAAAAGGGVWGANGGAGAGAGAGARSTAAGASGQQHKEWRHYWEWARRDFGGPLKEVQEERVFMRHE
ncbi:MAG: hypothetical protein M1826_000159 [Phylliscum demangeonii]|nr:MAG: hypothetical protein M1826_000159 [Phylliscum demangeonii]